MKKNEKHELHKSKCNCPNAKKMYHKLNCLWALDFQDKYTYNQKIYIKEVEQPQELFVCCCKTNSTPHDESLKFRLIKNPSKADYKIMDGLPEGKIVEKSYLDFNNPIFYDQPKIFGSLNGLGQDKTEVAKKAARHLKERNQVCEIIFKDLERINTGIEQKMKLGYCLNQEAYSYINSKKILFILDYCDDYIKYNKSEFETTLNEFAHNTTAKFLIITEDKLNLKLKGTIGEVLLEQLIENYENQIKNQKDPEIQKSNEIKDNPNFQQFEQDLQQNYEIFYEQFDKNQEEQKSDLKTINSEITRKDSANIMIKNNESMLNNSTTNKYNELTLNFGSSVRQQQLETSYKKECKNISLSNSQSQNQYNIKIITNNEQQRFGSNQLINVNDINNTIFSYSVTHYEDQETNQQKQKDNIIEESQETNYSDSKILYSEKKYNLKKQQSLEIQEGETFSNKNSKIPSQNQNEKQSKSQSLQNKSQNISNLNDQKKSSINLKKEEQEDSKGKIDVNEEIEEADIEEENNQYNNEEQQKNYFNEYSLDFENWFCNIF